MMLSPSDTGASRPVVRYQRTLALSLGHETNLSTEEVDRDILVTILKRLSAPNKLISIDDICERIGRSRAWAYENIVGSEAKKAKATPPFPWDWLPPTVPNSKSQWLESEFQQWFECFIARARAGERQGGAA
jgi:predicted DNA-binding transcriptional regulator AlpA